MDRCHFWPNNNPIGEIADVTFGRIMKLFRTYTTCTGRIENLLDRTLLINFILIKNLFVLDEDRMKSELAKSDYDVELLEI